MTLVDFWAAALALSLALYVLLDGFDLGVGILFPFAHGEATRQHMLRAISPVWDGNETWLVIAGTTLFGAFPLVYSVLLSAFYLPLFAMLGGLILRGVAFEFRYKTMRLRWLWDAGFVGGSYVASFVQGATVGALVQGLAIEHGRYVGGPFPWLSPFALLCGAGLCLGYALIGACWLMMKTTGPIQDFGYRAIPRLLCSLLVFLAAAFVYALSIDLPVMQRWSERPLLVALPVTGTLAVAVMIHAIRVRHDRLPFWMAGLLFLSAFATLAGSFVPYMVPFSITIEAAAAPESSLRFLFWGAGLFVFPVTIIYTAAVYYIFRGKVIEEEGESY
jgi:cytochrome d ubiquinol oxidase subunit II